MDNRLVSCLFRDLHENGFLVEGSAVLSRQHLDKPIPYKYVVVRGKNQVDYEYIYKPQQSNEHVNRCLQVKAALLGAGGESLAGPLGRARVQAPDRPKRPSRHRVGAPVGPLHRHCPHPCPCPQPPTASSVLKKPECRSPFLISVTEPFTSKGKPGEGFLLMGGEGEATGVQGVRGWAEGQRQGTGKRVQGRRTRLELQAPTPCPRDCESDPHPHPHPSCLASWPTSPLLLSPVYV